MGRELRRVPLDFDWPINKVWDGFLNPHYHPCPLDGTECFNGSTAASKWLEAVCRLMALIAQEAAEAPFADEMRSRGRVYPHPWLIEWGQAPRTELPRDAMERLRDIPAWPDRLRATERALRDHPPQLLPLTTELQQLIELLAGEKVPGMGSSSFAYRLGNRFKIWAGVDADTWGCCPVCKGDGHDPAYQAAIDAWAETPPPKGDGFQLWTTTNEGAPISPVFPTLDELCGWCEDGATVFGSDKVTKQRWREMLDAGFVRSEHVAGDGTKLVFT